MTGYDLRDLDQKWVITALCLDGGPPQLTLLWRTEGPRGRPLPKIGDVWTLPGDIHVRIERIDPPGTPLVITDRTLVLRTISAKDGEP